jgi:hypothetical protein
MKIPNKYDGTTSVSVYNGKIYVLAFDSSDDIIDLVEMIMI